MPEMSLLAAPHGRRHESVAGDTMTRRRLKHGVFHSVVDLQAAINRCINEHNQRPRPSVRPIPTNRRRRQTRAPNVGINPLASCPSSPVRPRKDSRASPDAYAVSA